MKRKWIIMGNERKFMRDVFEINDQELEDVKRFMEQEFSSVPDLMILLRKSSLNINQKMLASYIMGNTVGFSTAQDMQSIAQDIQSIDERRDKHGMAY